MSSPTATGLAEAYSRTGAAWQAGPWRVYDRLAAQLVGSVSARPNGALLDLGAGTGAVTRAARAAGWHVTALDIAPGMLLAADLAGNAVAGDAVSLPFHDGSFDAVVAAFSLNHVPQPVAAMGEAMRVLSPGGVFVASAYSEDDSHPAKRAVDVAATESGWEPPEWYATLREEVMPLLATPDRAAAALAAAGVRGSATLEEVPFPDLSPDDLIDWRLGMAHLATFAATLDDFETQRLRARAHTMLGATPEVLVRRMVVMRAVA